MQDALRRIAHRFGGGHLEEHQTPEHRFFRITWLGNDISIEQAIPIPWAPSFYAIPASFKLKHSLEYKRGEIIGMDVASGAAVNALGLKPGMRVLDLCCAPGSKLAYAAERVGKEGLVLGVDISPSRMDVCRKIVKKLRLKNVLLLCGDATELDFNINGEWAKHIGTAAYKQWEMPYDIERRKRKHYGKSEKRSQIAANIVQCMLADQSAFERILFDRVIVDAECTHDASVRHLEKFSTQWGWDTFERRVMDPNRLSGLQELQLKLLRNGFRHLRKGGLLLYSTCSGCKSQNSDIVNAFCEENSNAEKCPLPFQAKEGTSLFENNNVPARHINECECFFPGNITSGQYMCLITKNDSFSTGYDNN